MPSNHGEESRVVVTVGAAAGRGQRDLLSSSFVTECAFAGRKNRRMPDGCHQAYGKWLVKRRADNVEDTTPFFL